jgi:hypothetical protein
MSEDKRRGMVVLEFQMPDGRLLTEEQRATLIAGLEQAFNFDKDGPMTEWRRVALSKWRHFKEMVLAYEHAAQHPGTVSPSSVAIDVHMWTLVKTIPFILGLPEEALPELHERQQADRKLRRSALKSSYEQERLGEFGPHQHEEQLPAYPADGLDFADGEDPHAIRAEDLYKPRRWGRD